MGLAGAKNKRKLAKDPNNTKWSRNTDSFGHKILRSQGWQPGDYLGAKDAPHAEFHTAANASHVRVVLKEDNLGLGAKRNQGDECTGLDAFQQLLGRLNGKSEEVLETERKVRSDHQMNLYIHRKFGTMRFVKGGFLVGDQVLEQLAVKATEVRTEDSKDGTVTSSLDEVDAKPVKEKKSKKRKADDASESKEKKRKKQETEGDDKTDDAASRKEKKRKKRKQEKDNSTEEELNTEGEASVVVEKMKKDKKDKSKSKKSRSTEEEKDGDLKKKKSKRKDSAETSPEASETIISTPSTPLGTPSVSTPTGSGYSTPVSGVPGRHLARKRFIAQKRAAVMDQQALNQIFMIKS